MNKHLAFLILLCATSIGANAQSCANLLAGLYNGSDTCINNGSYAYNASVNYYPNSNPADPDTFIVSNFGGYGSNVSIKAVANCDSMTINIPVQPLGNAGIVSGSGTFNALHTLIFFAYHAIYSASYSEDCYSELVLTESHTGIKERNMIEAYCYPNPSAGATRLVFNCSKADVTVYDSYGRVIKTYPGASGSVLLDRSFFGEGVYFAKVNDGTHAPSVTRIVFQ
jgi:hypothetical protein